MSKSQLDRSLMDMITDPEFGTPDDKMRLFLIYYICSNPTMSQAEVDQYAASLRNAGCDLAPLSYMKRWKAYANMNSVASAAQYGGGGTKTVSKTDKSVTAVVLFSFMLGTMLFFLNRIRKKVVYTGVSTVHGAYMSNWCVPWGTLRV